MARTLRTDEPRISPYAMCCPDCGKPVYRSYEPNGRTHRYHDYCPRDGADLGFDAAMRRDDWERVQAHKRVEALAS